MTLIGVAAAVMCALLTQAQSWAGETDQYLVWNVELADSAPAFHDYLNETIEQFLGKANRRVRPVCDCETLVQELYIYLFRGLHASRVREWLNTSPEVDRFPEDSVSNWEYQQMSIYRGLSFPYVLPMSPTIRLGDVYLGVDKIGHFFGFGRRYYKRYLRFLERGDDAEEATRRVIRTGIRQEVSFVGKLVDGIFSHADLEANYQGFRMARDFCQGSEPYFKKTANGWEMTRSVNIRDYVTPDFDESYNNSHYWALRRKNVLPRLEKLYAEKRDEPIKIERFERYREAAPSISKRIIDDYFEGLGRDPQAEQSLAALCGEE